MVKIEKGKERGGRGCSVTKQRWSVMKGWVIMMELACGVVEVKRCSRSVFLL